LRTARGHPMRPPRLLLQLGCLEREEVREGKGEVGEDELGEVVAVEKDEWDEVAAVGAPLGMEEKMADVVAVVAIQMVVEEEEEEEEKMNAEVVEG